LRRLSRRLLWREAPLDPPFGAPVPPFPCRSTQVSGGGGGMQLAGPSRGPTTARRVTSWAGAHYIVIVPRSAPPVNTCQRVTIGPELPFFQTGLSPSFLPLYVPEPESDCPSPCPFIVNGYNRGESANFVKGPIAQKSPPSCVGSGVERPPSPCPTPVYPFAP
jgi:hypothetical protein